MKDLNLEGSNTWHRRGHYFTKIFGISFGGGQQRPGNFAHTAAEDAVWEKLRNTPEIQAVARRVDYLLACYFPKIHSLYTNVLSDICEADNSLVRNWENCCFAASSINLDSAITVYHHDWRNTLFGECAVKNCGPFDYKKGGNLVLWDLRLIIEFPPGCTAFFPSAMLAHSNTSIAPGEQRHSMTFFMASGLLRWRHNSYMSDKDFIAWGIEIGKAGLG
ncbi:hypothetical protein BT96DRAFT_835410 [Gymnopus androsaceus JB14]|uniref:Uncharacterized protein n=1 Tax=Gymnopus androsaceus JB14 TaxID=1447944 RepID=A0A6A4GTS6_9AGAR|nr:hypothetical protein BT96DRAFT_835410 [Gymnopus androsaceus JB14]